tara:strand:- start:259 stop:360 length:102 start_codon:yes stop_codon:yes gene_type:complete
MPNISRTSNTLKKITYKATTSTTATAAAAASTS